MARPFSSKVVGLAALYEPPQLPSFDTFLGVTPEEDYLAELCNSTFLRLWSHTGIYRSQSANPEDSHGKELCDLLVVFENQIIIFSDKACDYPTSGRPEVDWGRWYKRSIYKSARQLFGARRWLRNYPDRVYHDRDCQIPFAYRIAPPDEAQYHLIAVAHRSIDACREYFGGGSGTMMVTPFIIGEQHWHATDSWTPRPFTVGDVDPTEPLVHVLDDVSALVLLNYLDTITDFVDYLSAKERFIRSGRLVSAAGEEDLLGFYLQRLDEGGKHDFVVEKKYDTVIIDQGLWGEFLESDQYRSKVEADRISYFWDHLIEHFSEFIAQGGLVPESSPFASQEEVVRVLARESRMARRDLAEALADLASKPIDNAPRFLARVVRREGLRFDTTFVFLVADFLDNESEDEFRDRRRALLQAYCMVAKVKWPEIRDIVGVATMPMESKRGSEDIVYIPHTSWDEDMRREARETAAELPFLRNVRVRHSKIHEFPLSGGSDPQGSVRNVGRNQPCPCGSGRKYKKCCWIKTHRWR